MSPALPPTPGQTVGPFFGYALPYDRRQRAGATRPPPAPSGCTAGCTTAPGSRSRTRCSSSGRPTQTGRSSSRQGSLRRDGWTFTGWGACGHRRTGTTLHHARPGPTPGNGGVLRDHRLRPRPAQPAVHPGLPARRRRPCWTPTRCWPRCRGRGPGHADRRGPTSTGSASTSAPGRAGDRLPALPADTELAR